MSKSAPEKQAIYNKKYRLKCNADPDCVEKHKEMQRTYRARRYRDLKLNISCLMCGETHPATLDFHHRDPTQKKFKIAGRYGISMKRLSKEIAKCDVLCANCHRKEHYNGKMLGLSK